MYASGRLFEEHSHNLLTSPWTKTRELRGLLLQSYCFIGIPRGSAEQEPAIVFVG